jgi:hypothetical protein
MENSMLVTAAASDTQKATGDTRKNHCSRTLPGSVDCQGHVAKNECAFQKNMHGPCSGNIHAVGANVTQGEQFVSLHRLKRLEEYQSTQKGYGHLSTVRAVHASPVPFSANK